MSRCSADEAMTEDEVRFPDRDYPSDFELRLEPDGIVRLRSGTRITELTSVEARDLGAALTELADAAERS